MIRVGFFGAGGINGVHAAAVSRHADCEIVAVSSRTASRAQKLSENFAGGRARWYPEPLEMIRDARLDLLYVGIPPGAHSGEVETAAERGIHLLLEKPIALTLPRAESIRKAVVDAGVVCQVGFHLRHSAPVQALKLLVDTGQAGGPLLLTGTFFTDSLYSAWWRNPQLGGGQLVEQAIHLYDLARYFLGEPHSVAAILDNLNHRQIADYEVDDTSASISHFATGAVAAITASNNGPSESGGLQASLQFENALAELNGNGDGYAVRRDQQGARTWVRAQPRSAYEAQTADLLDAIRARGATRTTVHDGVEALRFVLAARRSAAESRFVSIDGGAGA